MQRWRKYRVYEPNKSVVWKYVNKAVEELTGISYDYTIKGNRDLLEDYFHVHLMGDDGEQEYDEIAVLELDLTDRRSASRLAEVVHRTIPYPVLLVAAHDDGVQLSAAAKRLSRSEKGRIVAASFELTPWLDGDERTTVEQDFLSSLHIDCLPHTHFQALYEGWIQRIVALACAELSGTFDAAPGRSFAERRADLDACRVLEREIRTLRTAVRAETSFARQVDLNTKLKRLETQLRHDVASL